MSLQDDRIEEGHIDLMEVQEQTRRLLQAEDSAKNDTERLAKLRPQYAALDKQLKEAVNRFNEACDNRQKARSKVSNIREEINTHLDEDAEFTVDLDEVEELCKMIEAKDRRLLLDLMGVKDQINQRQVNSEGRWKATAETASSIQLDEVAFTERDIILAENDDIVHHIEGDTAEIEKLKKIISKYQD